MKELIRTIKALAKMPYALLWLAGSFLREAIDRLMGKKPDTGPK